MTAALVLAGLSLTLGALLLALRWVLAHRLATHRVRDEAVVALQVKVDEVAQRLTRLEAASLRR